MKVDNFNMCVSFKVYEEEDKLLWCPDALSECKVRNYLREALSQTTDDCTSEHIRDNEQVFPLSTLSFIHTKIFYLYCIITLTCFLSFLGLVWASEVWLWHVRGSVAILQKCEDFKRWAKVLNQLEIWCTFDDTMLTCFDVLIEESPPWSEDECRNFEHALLIYEKNFHLIQKHKASSSLDVSSGY